MDRTVCNCGLIPLCITFIIVPWTDKKLCYFICHYLLQWQFGTFLIILTIDTFQVEQIISPVAQYSPPDGWCYQADWTAPGRCSPQHQLSAWSQCSTWRRRRVKDAVPRHWQNQALPILLWTYKKCHVKKLLQGGYVNNFWNINLIYISDFPF